MLMYEIQEIENSPSILNSIGVGEIVKEKKPVGFFISYKYEKVLKNVILEIEKIEKIEKLKKVAIAQKQDPIEEGGVDDGIK